MGEYELWLNAQDIGALRLQCSHCRTEAIFATNDPAGPSPEIRCPNCNMLMAGADRLVLAYREFMAEVKRHQRGARFLAKVTNPLSQT